MTQNLSVCSDRTSCREGIGCTEFWLYGNNVYALSHISTAAKTTLLQTNLSSLDPVFYLNTKTQ